MQNNEYELAIELFDMAISVGENLSIAYNNKGVALLRLGRCNESIKYLEMAITVNQTKPDSYINLALAQLCDGERDAAYQTLNRGIDYSDNHSGIILMRATMRAENSLYADAIMDYNRLLSADPHNSDLWYELSNLLFTIQDYEGAYKAIQNATNLSRDDPTLFFNQGVIEEKLAQFRMSLESYDKSIHLDPSNIKPYFNKGAIYWNHNRLNESAEAFSMVVKLDPSYSEGWFFLGLSQKELGLVNESKKSFSMAASLNPNNKMYRAYAERYQSLHDDMKTRPIPVSLIHVVISIGLLLIWVGKNQNPK